MLLPSLGNRWSLDALLFGRTRTQQERRDAARVGF
jgi:hypothetical protein